MSDLVAQHSYSIRCAACRGAFTLQRGLSGNEHSDLQTAWPAPPWERYHGPGMWAGGWGMGFFGLFTYVFFVCLHIFIFLKNKYFSWGMIVDSQCCVNYCCTAKWFRSTFIYILCLNILFHCGLSWDINQSSSCLTVGPRYLSIPYIALCIC